ncbi:MAG: PBSX family phage terminase large subunit [Bacteroidales bacterium]|nr:PBSX family phage terminase large subunit [Bacteroidales bacterium]
MEKTKKIHNKIPAVFHNLYKPARYKVFYGGRGGGRSWSFSRVLLTQGMNKPMLILCCREYQKSIEDSVHRLLSDQIKRMGLDDFYIIQKRSITGLNGTQFIFEGLRHNISKIKSMEGIDVCWVEEAETVSSDSWDVLIPTVRKKDSEIWMSFNPDQDSDPTYQRFVINPPPDSIVKKTSWRDNPWFPEALRKEKDYMYSVDPELAEHIWEGETRSMTDAQVLKGKWKVESFEPQDHWDGPYFGADFGFANDPNTLVRFWVEQLDEGTNLYIEYEAWGVGIDIDNIPEFYDRVPGSREYVIRADDSRPETISYIKQRGFRIIGPSKLKVEDGVSWLRSHKNIIIHPRCEHTKDEAKHWSYKTDRLTGDVLPQLKDGMDHIWDAVRYGAKPLIKDKSNLYEPV